MPVWPVMLILEWSTPSRTQILGGLLGGGEVQFGEMRSEDAIHLFGERLMQVAGAEARLHVCHWNSQVEGGERAAERCGGIALHDDQCGTLGREHVFERA